MASLTPAGRGIWPEGRYAVVDGHRAHYWDVGSGPALLLIHGLGNSSLVWHRAIEGLAQSHRVIALDLPGHGWSDMPDRRFDLPAAAAFTARLMQKVAPGPFAIGGGSLGGLIGLETALTYSDRVTALVLVDSAGLGHEIAWSLRILSTPVIGDILERPTEERLRRVLRNLILYDPSHAEEQFIKTLFGTRARPGAAHALLQFLRVGVNVFGQKRSVQRQHRLAELRMPMLICWGKQDRIVPVAHGERAARLQPSAQLKLFDRCGHWPHFEHPADFVETVNGFLAGVASHPSS
jgi:4,5:9,10-diseco-3-hydroxy-5,9,17-trioxoandrosta-1(10),2-diene-4-oate hydrolase